MAILTQGTQIFILVDDPDNTGTKKVVEIVCPMAFQPGEDSADQIDITCLSAKTRSFLDGLRTPGQGTLTINADSRESSHRLLYELSMGRTSEGKEPFLWAVGWSDGTSTPTANGNEFSLPTDRTWLTFMASVSTFPFDFSGNTVVATSCTISRSGDSAWVPKGSGDYPTIYTLTPPSAGFYYLAMGGQRTAFLEYNTAFGDVQSALDDIKTDNFATVTVTAGTGNMTITFTTPTAMLLASGATLELS